MTKRPFNLFFRIIVFYICFQSCSTQKEVSQEVQLTTLWNQSESSYNNFRIPAVVVTQKHTVLAFAEGREGGDAGNIDILVKRSNDNGLTWSTQEIVWDDGSNTCGNPCPVVDRESGRILLFMTWNLGSDHESKIINKESEDYRRPYLVYSDDDGKTWSEPVDLSNSVRDPDWGWYATGPGVGIQLKSAKYYNRLIIPANHSYTVENEEEAVRDGYGYGAHVLISDDSGKSWRKSNAITPGCNESQIVELSNGDLLMNMRSYNKKNSRALSISKDGGESWSDLSHDPQLVESICQASIIEYGMFNGKKMFLFANPAVPYSRSHMTIKTSFDDCETWSNGKLIFNGPAAYSSLTVLPNGKIGLFFERGRQSPYEKMVFVSFKPEELFKAGELISID